VDNRRLWNLIGAPGLAMTSLLFVFLLLGWQKAGATQEGVGTASGIGAPSAAFTVSGTIVCGATGPISDVEVFVWDQVKSTVVTSDTTDHSGAYSVTLDEDTYLVEFIPPVAAGLNAKGFSTMEIVTDTTLSADFCACSGVWISETVGKGLYTSLALPPTYPSMPHITYLRDNQLKHAWRWGTNWLTETVDPIGGQKTTSLALAPAHPYTPCVSYHDRYAYWGVKLACLGGTTWISQVVMGGHFEGEGGVSLALAPAYPYTPHICYNLGLEIPGLRLSYLSGTAWMSGTWVEERVDNGPGGWSCSLALAPTYPYTPHIGYATPDGVKHAWKSGTTWLSETVDSVGGEPSLALEVAYPYTPHISYRDFTSLGVKHAWKSGTTWLSETVDNEGDMGGWGGPSLALDPSGNSRMSYFDNAHGNLKWARFDGTVWIVQTVDSADRVGWYSSLALDRVGCPHISYYDWTDGDLKHASIPPCLVHLPLVMRNYTR
jgi:hypothetical protein